MDKFFVWIFESRGIVFVWLLVNGEEIISEGVEGRNYIVVYIYVFEFL